MKTGYTQARGLLPNDHIKIAGTMYRIVRTQHYDWTVRVVTVRADLKKPNKFVQLVVHRKTRFKIYFNEH